MARRIRAAMERRGLGHVVGEQPNGRRVSAHPNNGTDDAARVAREHATRDLGALRHDRVKMERERELSKLLRSLRDFVEP